MQLFRSKTHGTLMFAFALFAGVALLSSGAGTKALAQTYEFPFISHGGEENPFWSQVYEGYQAAKERYDVEGKLYRPPEEGDLEWQLRTWKAVLARNPDGILTTIPDPNMYDQVIKRAIDRGIPVISVNTDDPKGAAGNARMAYIGQEYYDAGYLVAKTAVNEYFPNPSPQNLDILITIGAPGEVWAEERKRGMMDFLVGEYGVPEGNIDTLDSTMDISKIQSRVIGYLKGHPETNMVLSTQYSVGGYLAAKSLGMEPGELTVAGFDLVPTVVEGVKEGYIDFTIDQQPFLQGYLPVVQLYHMKKQGTRSFNVNTGMAIVDQSTIGRYD